VAKCTRTYIRRYTNTTYIYIYEKERKKITKGIGRRKEMSKRKKEKRGWGKKKRG